MTTWFRVTVSRDGDEVAVYDVEAGECEEAGQIALRQVTLDTSVERIDKPDEGCFECDLVLRKDEEGESSLDV